MLRVHGPGEPAQAGHGLAITATGGQTEVRPFLHPRSFRFPHPLQTPLTVGADSAVVVNYSAKLSEFIPSLENFTRAEIKSKILNHERNSSSPLYPDIFFNLNMEPGDVFQCPHGPNTWWKYGMCTAEAFPSLRPQGCMPEDLDDFDVYVGWYDFILTNAFSTLAVPITIHTSETAGFLL